MIHLSPTASSDATSAQSNFLVPNATFLFEIVSFLIIMYVLWKWVLPPINKAMTERQEKIRAQFEEAAQAKSDAESTEAELKAQLAAARAEASRIREEASEQGEAERITSNAQAQIEVERAQALSQLKGEVGSIATTLAGRIVGESLDDDDRQKRSVERFIAELESDSGKSKS